MSELWAARPGVAAWLARMWGRPSYHKAVSDVVPADAIEILREHGGREWARIKAMLGNPSPQPLSRGRGA